MNYEFNIFLMKFESQNYWWWEHHLLILSYITATSNEMDRKHLNVMTNNLFFHHRQAVQISTTWRACNSRYRTVWSIIERRMFAKCFIHNFLLTFFFCFCFCVRQQFRSQNNGTQKSFPYLNFKNNSLSWLDDGCRMMVAACARNMLSSRLIGRKITFGCVMSGKTSIEPKQGQRQFHCRN